MQLPCRNRARRPRGWLRHYASLLSPRAASAIPLTVERNALQRLGRIAKTVGDGAAQRARPSRPKMRALVALPGGKLRWREVPAPRPPGPYGAIVHPIAAATCDIECPLALGATPLLLPLHMGHECVAEVLSVGERVHEVKPGDRVIVPFQISCGACVPCKAGLTGNCERVPPISMYGMGMLAGHWGGAFSDELAVPYADAMLISLPPAIDPVAAASLADNVCDAYRHLGPHLPALLGEDPEAEVLILGALDRHTPFGGSVPLYAALIAKAFGAHNVVLADERPEVRALAQRLGCDAERPRRLRGRRPAPLVVDASVDGLAKALSHVAHDGVCSSSGSFAHSAKIPALHMYVRNVTLHFGRTHARALIPSVLELMAERGLRPQDVVTSVAPLDHAPSALREHFDGGVKLVLTA